MGGQTRVEGLAEVAGALVKRCKQSVSDLLLYTGNLGAYILEHRDDTRPAEAREQPRGSTS